MGWQYSSVAWMSSLLRLVTICYSRSSNKTNCMTEAHFEVGVCWPWTTVTGQEPRWWLRVADNNGGSCGWSLAAANWQMEPVGSMCPPHSQAILLTKEQIMAHPFRCWWSWENLADPEMHSFDISPKAPTVPLFCVLVETTRGLLSPLRCAFISMGECGGCGSADGVYLPHHDLHELYIQTVTSQIGF